MYIAGALSRAYLKTTDGAQTGFCEIRALEMVNHEEHIQVTPPKRDEFRQRFAQDADIQERFCVIKQVWPNTKKCPPAVQPYHDERGELIESQGLVENSSKSPFHSVRKCFSSSAAVTSASEDVFAVPLKYCFGHAWVLRSETYSNVDNLPNIPTRTYSWRASTTRAAVTPLAKDSPWSDPW